ncbi:hypothetical protein BK816_03855 [Boudabousia tangfeifanii]|uniref:Glutamine amidotransferase domain-containing protein n=1 Tax=Boudabousia tangfeifanii TaxID=1912795 RepID=A0A1D9MJQ6_9ACTO|nr:type 1 glutamine amidotransferase [Boudabousia tangfeifanii]AOZ72537.1 hypothetical protein BK816_03855 [Boudabousia tangfeifanii]
MGRKVLVIQHEADIPLGILADMLDKHSLEIEIIKAWTEPEQISILVERFLTADLSKEYVALIVLGGRANAYAVAEHPYLAQIHRLLPLALAQEIKVLGICLGHQLLTVAMDGEVELSAKAGPEYGRVQLSWSEDLPLELAKWSHVKSVYADHADCVSKIPTGAKVLATSNKCVQIMQLGEYGLSVQFHPEVDEHIVRDWQRTQEVQLAAEIIADFPKYAAENAQMCQYLADWVAG